MFMSINVMISLELNSVRTHVRYQITPYGETFHLIPNSNILQLV